MKEPVLLTFEIVDLLHFFTVAFESESRARNRIQEVEFKGFKLDVAEIKNTHPLLYGKMNNEMQRVSNAYWNEEEEVPTLAYQSEAKPVSVYEVRSINN